MSELHVQYLNHFKQQKGRYFISEKQYERKQRNISPTSEWVLVIQTYKKLIVSISTFINLHRYLQRYLRRNIHKIYGILKYLEN